MSRPVRPGAPSEKRATAGTYRLTFDDQEFVFETQPGVFSANQADEGSLLLLESLLPHVRPHHTVLDLGTGNGLLGIVLARRLTRGHVWMVDADIRATRLAERNRAINQIENAQVILSDVTADLPSRQRFDVVVSNPPTHDGREVLRQFVEEAYGVLKPGGSLWVVVNRLLSIRDLMSASFGNCEAMERHKGFIVLKSEKQRLRTGSRRGKDLDIA